MTRASSGAVSITPLLQSLISSNLPQPSSLAKPIASAISLIFTNQLSPVQCASLLTLLRVLRLDHDPHVIAACAQCMREAAPAIDLGLLQTTINARQEIARGTYRGGLCDLVGTGGDGHSTFNISTTASIIASSLLLVAKHGNRASSSVSGSADLLASIQPNPPTIEAITPSTLPTLYAMSNYGFLFAPRFHPGMQYAATVRKSLGIPTIFNILGPLANCTEPLIEARVIGVPNKELGSVFAEVLRLGQVKKALVVCGIEGLDEISCAGYTHCWRLVESKKATSDNHKNQQDDDETESEGKTSGSSIIKVETFNIAPEHFGLRRHALSKVSPGKTPQENAEILRRLLACEMDEAEPLMDFVLMNAAALFVIAGVCETEGHEVIRETGPGKGRWMEGVRLARKVVREGTALRTLEAYIKYSNEAGKMQNP